jgi:phage-related protein
MAGKPVRVAFLADTADLRTNLDKAKASMNEAAAEAKTAGQKIDAAFDSTAESADGVASKGSQAAGALSGLGDLVGGKFGTAMMAGGVAMQGFADAGDLVNVVTESNIVRKIKDTAVTIGQKAAIIASTVAQKAAAAASKAWAAAQWLLNAAMTANPLGLLAVALVALVAALVVAYRKSETFRAIVNSAFGAVQRVVSKIMPAILKVIETVWKAVKVVFTTYFKVYRAIVTTVFDIIKAVIAKAMTTIRDKITGAFSGVIDFIRSVPGKIRDLGSKFYEAGQSIMGRIVDGIKHAAGFIGSIATGIWDAVKGMINSAIDKINSALEFKISLPGPDITINAPDIPHLASGGIVYGPTLALIGEAGPEAVVPLNGRFGTTTIYNYAITVQAGVGDPVAIGREVSRVVKAYEKAGGRR